MVSIPNEVLLDVDATVAGAVIHSGGTLRFDPSAGHTLQSTGNVIVQGTLQMRPASRDVVHTLRFLNVNESRFVGGGTDVLTTDVGLWVRDNGMLDLQGTPRTPWARGRASDWTDADTLVICPSARGDFTGFQETVASRLPSNLPTVSGGGQTWTTEVLNITRNVRIQGTPSHRTHVHIMSMMPQTVRYVELSYLGPRQGSDFVLGRYALHFHMAGTGVNGSVVEGVVAHDCGSHCFVPHSSDGVTFTGCVAYNVYEDPFWWDLGDATNNITWQDCVAALVNQAASGSRLSGFTIGVGENNSCLRCVAIGVQGIRTTGGFLWPEIGPSTNEGVWNFQDCIAHNNEANGIFVWQNTHLRHVIDRFSAYRNGDAGIFHGAYVNPYLYQNSVLYENNNAGVSLVARSNPFGLLQFNSVTVDGGGVGEYGFVAQRPQSGIPGGPAHVNRCQVTGVGRNFAIAYTNPSDTISDRFIIA